MRYLRWGRDGEAVQPEKGYGVENCLRLPQNPQRQVHALLAGMDLPKPCFANQAHQNLLCPKEGIILEYPIRDLPAM